MKKKLKKKYPQKRAKSASKVGFTFKTSKANIALLKKEALRVNLTASRLLELAFSEYLKSDKTQLSLV